MAAHARVQFVNNYYKPGPATKWLYFIRPQLEWVHLYGPQEYFISGNVIQGHVKEDNQAAGVKLWPGVPEKDYLRDQPFFESHVTTQTAADAYASVLADVGCSFPMLDDHDQRILDEVLTSHCAYRGSQTDLPGLPDSQADVGGWEEYPVVDRPADWDTDRDGMPDDWEQARGLDADNAADGNRDRDDDGYTNLEEYLGWLVGEFTDSGTPATDNAVKRHN